LILAVSIDRVFTFHQSVLMRYCMIIGTKWRMRCLECAPMIAADSKIASHCHHLKDPKETDRCQSNNVTSAHYSLPTQAESRPSIPTSDARLKARSAPQLRLSDAHTTSTHHPVLCCRYHVGTRRCCSKAAIRAASSGWESAVRSADACVRRILQPRVVLWRLRCR
jgi:hypothetical protein